MKYWKEKEINPVEKVEFWTGSYITKLAENEIFLYGSNPQGINGAGAAKAAMSLSKGAKHGVGRGFNGSNAYALVTKSLKAGFLEKSTGILYDKEGYCSVSPEQIRTNIDELYEIAKSQEHKNKKFLVSYQYETWPNGNPKKSLNGYTSQEMLEMFAKDKNIPSNIVFHESYKPHLEKLYKNQNKQSNDKFVVYDDGETIDIKEEDIVWTIDSDERNPQARHFAGAAKKALSFGAIPINRSKNTLGICRGLSPNNKTYALITKSLEAGYIEPETQILYDKEGFLSVSPEQISSNIDELYRIARMQEHKDKKFLITYQYQTWPNGSPKKSLNGYTSKEMFDMFVIDKDIPPNIVFHESYEPHIKNLYKNKEEEVDKKYTYFFYLKSPFSNFHPAKFNYKNINFISNEQFMMYCKAKLFQDEVVAQKIIDINNTPLTKEFIEGKISTQDIINNESLVKDWQQLMQKIKKLGREVKSYNEDVWVKKRLSIVFFGAKLKFTQNKDLEKKLLSTGNTIMVEASRFDKIWGCGLQESEAKITEEKDWPGLNLLGKVLTKLKTQLNNELNNKSGIEVVNFYKIGKKIPENGVYIGRENKGLGLKQSKFANPFKMKGDGDKERKRVLNEYKGWVWKELNKGNITLNEVLDLKDKKLVCYCSPKSCHGDVLRSLVNYVLNNKSNLEKETNQKLKI